MSTDLSRRRFLEFLAASAGVTLIGCGKKPDEPPPAAPVATIATANADGTFSLSIPQLLKPGTALAFQLPDGEPAVIFQTGAGETGALSARCTHAGCTVQWQNVPGKELHCPCHDSVFDARGAVKSGPAKKPLARLGVELQGKKAILRPS